MIQKCPSCQSPLDVSSFAPGQQVKCYSCQGVITVEAQPQVPAPAYPAAAAPPAQPGKSSSGCIIAGIVVAVIFVVLSFISIIAAIAIPGLLRARVASNETAAIGTLRTLATSQAQFQASGIIDQDEDAEGEYGFLQELAGVAPFRGGEEPVSPAFITSVLGTTAMQSDGIAGKSGYQFLVYLPDGQGGWIAESSPLPAGAARTANAQEQRFICYAWPVSLGNSGNRAFVVTEKGEVFATANKDFQGYGGLSAIPEPEAAFPEGSLGVEQQLETGVVAYDGYVWIPAGF